MAGGRDGYRFPEPTPEIHFLQKDPNSEKFKKLLPDTHHLPPLPNSAS